MERKIDRFDKYMKAKSLNDNKVTIDLSLSIGTLGKSRKENRDLSSRIVEQILNYYTDLDRTWLLTGEGEMLKKEASPIQSDADTAQTTTTAYTTYLLPMSAMGGSLTGFAAPGATLKECEIIVSPIENVDFAITVYGDSMAPEYPSGSRILIKKIDPSLFIEWGKTYVLDTPNGISIKEVLDSEKEGFITCHSINPDPKFKNFDVPLAEIYGMYRVLMCLSIK